MGFPRFPRFPRFLFLFIFFIFLFYFYFSKKETFETNYLQRFKNKENRTFPFRYFTDENDNVLPFVAITGPFREPSAKKKYREYLKQNILIFGITAYKTFPNTKLFGKEEGEYERKDDFDYTREIKNWLCCLKDKESYGFSKWNHIEDISESDFYDAEEENTTKNKKYDFIYVCNKDADTCPKNGWNAINRNFELALECFPIMCNEYNWKGLVVGRVGCGLEKIYGDKLEIVDWLDYHILQDKMRESRVLFIPNVLDASPRVISECLVKDVPILMNRNILCGTKYVNYETGELFTDTHDLRGAIDKLQQRMYKISPRKWWSQNHSKDKGQKALRDFLAKSFPGTLDESVKRVKFIL
jgi:hypothetical protein